MQEVIDAVDDATGRVCDGLERTDLLAPSKLPGWSRLTIACHLRYGAEAMWRMAHDAIAGRPTAYYPGGREAQRLGTLVPKPDEEPADVVRALRLSSAALVDAWEAVGDWSVMVEEPPGNGDLGPFPLHRQPLMRLTEVEVHGTDLGIGLGPWSEVLVREVLPMRLDWLGTRRSNHREVDRSVQGSFLLVASDDSIAHRLVIDGDRVTSSPATPGDTADRVITAPVGDLLALLLGRWTDASAEVDAFRRAFPGP